MRNGMPRCFVQMIDKFKDSHIRDECEKNSELKMIYNQIIEEYCNFYRLHNEWITNFLLRNDKGLKTGTAGMSINMSLRKDELIRKFRI